MAFEDLAGRLPRKRRRAWGAGATCPRAAGNHDDDDDDDDDDGDDDDDDDNDDNDDDDDDEEDTDSDVGSKGEEFSFTTCGKCFQFPLKIAPTESV